MASNFLGDVGGSVSSSSIISANELMTREGVDLKKGMNFRDSGGLLSVFLVLPREDGFQDAWDEDSELYTYDGHDSTTVEGGKLHDQIAMYPDGRVTDNGKFFKAANALKDGMRAEPLQVQVYEKLDPGVWFDKGIFNLMEAKRVTQDGRVVFKFYLNPAGTRDGAQTSDAQFTERMINATDKEVIWRRDMGRCAECGVQSELHFSSEPIRLLCAQHSGIGKRGLL